MQRSRSGRGLWPTLLLIACCRLQACAAAETSTGTRHRREASEETLLHGGSGHHQTNASLAYPAASDTAFAASSSNASLCPSGVPAHLDQKRLRDFDCLVLHNVCIDQTRFIIDQDELRPGRTFWSDDLFDIAQHDINDVSGEGPFYNVPGLPDNWKGAKKRFRKPFFRIRGTHEPADIKAADYDECSLPLVWWPAWPFMGDYYLSSLAPLEHMQRLGLFDKSVRFTPVMDGLAPAPQVRWLLEPFTNHKVQTLEEISDRSNMGNRCFKQLVLCKLYSLWHKRPVLDWTTGMQFGTIGQQIVEHLRPQLTEVSRDSSAFRIGWIERKNKRIIRDQESIVAQCNTWEPPKGSDYSRTECLTINFDDSSKYLEQISIVQSLDVMVAMHGSGLINHNLMRPNTAFVEVVPCHFDSGWQEYSFQKPARQENIQFAFEIKVTNEAYCWPSQQTKDEHKPDLSDADWVWGSFVRDQDVTLNVTLLQEVLGKIVALKGRRDLYQQLDQSSADYAFVKQE